MMNKIQGKDNNTKTISIIDFSHIIMYFKYWTDHSLLDICRKLFSDSSHGRYGNSSTLAGTLNRQNFMWLIAALLGACVFGMSGKNNSFREVHWSSIKKRVENQNIFWPVEWLKPYIDMNKYL